MDIKNQTGIKLPIDINIPVPASGWTSDDSGQPSETDGSHLGISEQADAKVQLNNCNSAPVPEWLYQNPVNDSVHMSHQSGNQMIEQTPASQRLQYNPLEDSPYGNLDISRHTGTYMRIGNNGLIPDSVGLYQKPPENFEHGIMDMNCSPTSDDINFICDNPIPTPEWLSLGSPGDPIYCDSDATQLIDSKMPNTGSGPLSESLLLTRNAPEDLAYDGNCNSNDDGRSQIKILNCDNSSKLVSLEAKLSPGFSDWVDLTLSDSEDEKDEASRKGSFGSFQSMHTDEWCGNFKRSHEATQTRAASVLGGQKVVQKKSTSSQLGLPSMPVNFLRVGGERLKAHDERLTYRVALEDLSQTKLEISPPEGVLSMPLLRHQRIALSWMVQKETASLHCCGGILADDQGLGKTISTIALILMERSPSSNCSTEATEHDKPEALNLDEDDETGVSAIDGLKDAENSESFVLDKKPLENGDSLSMVKGRPAAGTLVVCPTSVLRQWAEELQNKVTEKAKLSVLVYHGSHRTKDPIELAKYDVVLTTYSIVSMEVPKQSLVDQDEEDRKSPQVQDAPLESSGYKKRKHPHNATNKSLKDKKRKGGSLLESAARPLARVGWFRVVLDEAQSIKNHRTQVARACWGLRAKRRWCLSGTPIQNAVDDLYSYFRFLRYDPYAVYKSFCSMIKAPISRNPAVGYKKLQAVLKTIMLRRTKGTLLDGEPIVTLPPKSVLLKKIDFSMEERDFYSKLEEESRAQFEVYAAEGTVKQNYVNILLMLLRLRQACDHRQLVKGYDSNSIWKSSVEMARKLPKEKLILLWNCLGACLAICGSCNDSPEDAVVTICGHVFCNQCIREHLTTDENICPAAQCGAQLSTTSIFSRATLSSCIFDQSDNGGFPCHPGQLEPFETNAELGLSCNSSKIKTAIEILQSLSKPKLQNTEFSSRESCHEMVCAVEKHANSVEAGGYLKLHGGTHMTVDKHSDMKLVKVAEKAIVFSQWTRMLDLLEVPLKDSCIQYRRLDGTMSVVARDKAVKDFNTLPEVTVLIMSLKAASLGLNLIAASHVILMDLWWNPTTEDQAIDRAHRIGQTRPVTVSRLTVKDTVEDRILALQEKKREMVASAFGEDENGGHRTRLTVEDLKYLFMV
ncbi:helicase-like transcription factor CHR28 isoform X1 [Amborella trichopoda]|nr:helicase-like transcription factor CHR28 isoform X1 [Amborella trichopoda]|eukprot:XP_006841730.2 helicase-like transcription factor CHR28 isoform X1 [Amborella trichopoda]